MSSLKNMRQQPIVPATYAEFRSWLLRYVEDVWGLPENFNNEMDIDFEVLGMDSLEAHMMASLLEDEYGISPGQACVFYKKDEFGFKVLGGGWIVN